LVQILAVIGFLACIGITGTDRIWSTAHRNMSCTITNGNLMLFITCIFLKSIYPPTNAQEIKLIHKP